MASVADIVNRHFEVSSDTGEEWLVLCRWHADTSPSMYVNVRKGTFFCHVCKTGGGRKKLMELLGISGDGYTVSPEAFRRRLDERGKTKADRMPKLKESVLDTYRFIPTDYWTAVRGLSEATVELLELGYDLDRDAGVIPVRSEDGVLRGLIRRLINPPPGTKLRYRYSKGLPISRILYGAHLVSGDVVAVTEGTLDTAALLDVGIESMALLGARMSRAQWKILSAMAPRSVVVFTDNDKAGRDAALQVAAQMAGRTRVKLAVYDVPKERWPVDSVGKPRPPKDPGDLQPEDRLALFHGAVPVHRC